MRASSRESAHPQRAIVQLTVFTTKFPMLTAPCHLREACFSMIRQHTTTSRMEACQGIGCALLQSVEL